MKTINDLNYCDIRRHHTFLAFSASSGVLAVVVAAVVAALVVGSTIRLAPLLAELAGLALCTSGVWLGWLDMSELRELILRSMLNNLRTIASYMRKHRKT